MKVKQCVIVMTFVLCFSFSANAENESRVAVYDARAIYKAESIQRKIYMLHVEKDVKKAMLNIGKEVEGILLDIVKSEDQEEIRTLQNRVELLENKQRSIVRVIRNRSNRREENDILQFIQNNYKDKYDVIFEKGVLSSSYSDKIYFNVDPVDITEVVIDDIIKEINRIE